MSTLFVDTINEKTSGNGIHIPGHVIQVVQTLHGDTVAINGTTHAEYSNISTTITPKATGSHILCHVIITGGNSYNGGIWFETFLYRDSTSNLLQEQEIYFNSQYEVIGPRPFFNMIDTTATTAGAARTYKVFVAAQTASGGQFLINWPDNSQAVSSMTLMEIAQ